MALGKTNLFVNKPYLANKGLGHGLAEIGLERRENLRLGGPYRVHQLVELSDAELVALHTHKNEWHVRTARRLLQDRAALGKVDGRAIAVFNIAGTYYCIADVCSHDDGPVAEGDLNGFEIECPRHGAHFDVRRGKVLSVPAIVDIPAYPVRVDGADILVGLPPAA